MRKMVTTLLGALLLTAPMLAQASSSTQKRCCDVKAGSWYDGL